MEKNVKRRFKEFVVLQKCLEENAKCKGFMRNIKGPSKVLNLPIGNMDEELIEKRRNKLSQFLNVILPTSLLSKTIPKSYE